MSQHQVRPTGGASTVLVNSALIHKEKGRTCEKCGAAWTVKFNDGEPQAYKDGIPLQGVILDCAGNNVAVECCRFSS